MHRSLLLLGMLLLVPPAAADVAEDVEAMVRSPWFEGLPQEAVDALGPEACPHLLGWLGDSDAATHATAIEALGRLGCPGAYEAIAAYADAASGEVDRTKFRALRACPEAIGRLARRDDRALARLVSRARVRSAPAWTFREQRGARLALEERRRATRALLLTGRPEAAAQIRDLQADPALRPVFDEAAPEAEAGSR